jgi:hypothetical protein
VRTANRTDARSDCCHSEAVILPISTVTVREEHDTHPRLVADHHLYSGKLLCDHFPEWQRNGVWIVIGSVADLLSESSPNQKTDPAIANHSTL